METIFLVYKTDSWHSYASRDLIGACTSKELAIDVCKKKAEGEGDDLSEEQLFNLNNIKQTQGYSGHGEFQYEEIDLNTLF
jgi:hypothetical protein